MPRPSSLHAKSILRVKDGVRRFLENMAGEGISEEEEMENEETTGKTAASSQTQDTENLPEDLVRIAEMEAATLQAESRQIAQWRQELERILKDREERQAYFADLAKERGTRFAQMLQSARDQLAGKTPSDFEQAHEAESEEDTPVSEPTATASASETTSSIAPQPYATPTVDLLDASELDESALVSPDSLEQQERALQGALDNFAVDALVYDAVVGPRVTQFRVRPGIGVRVEKIAALQKNISLALAQTNVRIQAPIPGEPFVGIEVGNGNTLPIRLRSVFESKAWRQGKETIPLAIGMDIQGKIVVADLAKAPHLMIAGATGSGKSVCMSNLILSLLYKFSPEELELVLIDPKRVEFGLFREVPHLIHSVVGEAKTAVQVLKWVVQEMETRYEILAEKQVRNIAGYNAKAEAQGFEKMPFMVVIIDELADLMMTSKGEAEASLARIAQLSRAVGIHTIIATQRPSVNVITGVIKANYPTRIAFQVSSLVDSRTILDCKGAESLLGQGDMLFNPPGFSRLLRIQSPMVQDEELTRVVTHVSQNQAERHRVDLSSVAGPGDGERDPDQEGLDDLFKEALAIVAESQKASTSYLQRRLRIGYNRAATLIEEMEDRFYIGPQNGSTPREVFITPEELAQ
ncbi:DNA translocase FtsK [Pelagicoccus sp. SDUM812003]|uniref:DNA translocase FtsK n=1 Tax=Pelagicoccus sp. SDUM812003 TaxID=3041267 RepID=UPI00280FCC46|nr:DNA translocase FtsK [Pelagicoccus sp. SDUM812003]MDQ8203571.1 DNA translocase FtsK [Pelagicoccus sp. SDUM812003]